MSMIFQIRMICDEDERFIRDYELSYAMTLLEFHEFICRDLGYDPMNMASFFRSNERWEQQQEFTLIDMGEGGEGAPVPMDRVTLGQVLRHNNDRLIYVFDAFGERVMFLELMGSFRQSASGKYPHTVFSQGDPPPQFEIVPGASEGDTDLFGEAMDDYFDFEGDDFYGDD